MNRKKKGFTLIELMIAITLIVIVIVLSSSIFIKSYKNCRYAQCDCKFQTDGVKVLEFITEKTIGCKKISKINDNKINNDKFEDYIDIKNITFKDNDDKDISFIMDNNSLYFKKDEEREIKIKDNIEVLRVKPIGTEENFNKGISVEVMITTNKEQKQMSTEIYFRNSE